MKALSPLGNSARPHHLKQILCLAIAIIAIGQTNGFAVLPYLRASCQNSVPSCPNDCPSHPNDWPSHSLSLQSSHSQSDNEASTWELQSTLTTITSPWLTIHNERLKDGGTLLDYWRVEKDDSAVIVTIHQGYFCFPRQSYRPGVGRATLDFPGGKIPPSSPLDGSSDDDDENVEMVQRQEVASNILKSELGILDTSRPSSKDDIYADFYAINAQEGYAINSSFSNQRLYGFVAILRDEVVLDTSRLSYYKEFPATVRGARELLVILPCLQCRILLLEWVQGQLLLLVDNDDS